VCACGGGWLLEGWASAGARVLASGAIVACDQTLYAGRAHAHTEDQLLEVGAMVLVDAVRDRGRLLSAPVLTVEGHARRVLMDAIGEQSRSYVEKYCTPERAARLVMERLEYAR